MESSDPYMPHTTTTYNNSNLQPTENVPSENSNSIHINTNSVTGDPQECRRYLDNLRAQNCTNNAIYTNRSSNNQFTVDSPNTANGHYYDSSTTESSSHGQGNDSQPSKIIIKCQPKSTYYPRTKMYLNQVLHYIQSEENSTDKYPSIYLFPEWKEQSFDNIIEVAHIDVDEELHPYPMRYNEASPDIWTAENNGPSYLIFVFQIAICKLQQGNGITKKIIHDKQLKNLCSILHESIWIVKRISTQYKNIAVKHINPNYGPLASNQIVDVVFTGFEVNDKNKLRFQISAEKYNWTHEINTFDSTGTKIVVFYEEESIYESPYEFNANIDHGITKKSSEHISIRNLQNFLLVWLDINIDEENNPDCCNTIRQLRETINCLKIFTDVDQCIDFITNIEDEKVFLILSGSLGQTIVPVINNISQIDSIYVFCRNERKHKQWAEHWLKIRGVFTNIQLICEELKQAANQCDKNAISIGFISSDQNSDQINSSFIKKPNISLQYARRSLTNLDLIGVLFVIIIDPCLSSTPFASIKNVSCYQSEREILFSMHSVFRIGQSKQIDYDNDRLWQVELILTIDNDPQRRVLTERIRADIRGINGWQYLGKFLIMLGQFQKADDLYTILLDRTRSESDRAQFYHHLGKTSIYYNSTMNSSNDRLPLNNLNQLHKLDYVNNIQSFQSNNLLVIPRNIDNIIVSQGMLNSNETMLENMEVNDNQSTSVILACYTSNSNKMTSCDTTQISNDSTYLIKSTHLFDHMQSIKIQIKHQPRSKFRPRTQTESKTSSHYIRCEEDSVADYPTIYIPQIWARQSEMNIIEVKLVDIEKNPHPYSINNKTSKNKLDEAALVLQENESNTLFFRLTNEDFLSGCKGFMIEFIKSKQDHVITKKLISLRNLHQSMLCFTRIYRDINGHYQRDFGSEAYSCIMTENYGDISIEHMGPRYGPMDGQEMVFIVFKGRITKEDISVTIFENETNWHEEIKHFSLNGNVIYFPMLPCPNSERTNVQVMLRIYYKKEKIHESKYMYMSLLKQNLLDNNMNDTFSDSLSCDSFNDIYPMSMTIPKGSKKKSQKRLNSN
ncbi:hypothetical protein I4U23_009970 [Adineta vaga]|nr:hypothetical protein I4U23_009970 [Adineta vaga]